MNMTMTSKMVDRLSIQKTTKVTIIVTGGWNVPTIKLKTTMRSTVKSAVEHYCKAHRGHYGNYDSYYDNMLRKLIDGVFILTREPHRDSERVDIDDRLDELFYVSSINPDKPYIELFMWDLPVNPCNRCGICCMFGFYQHSDAYNTPISKDKWVGRGVNRCVNLQFNIKKGVYGCAMVNERSQICERFFCDYLRGSEQEVQSSFGKDPSHPQCHDRRCCRRREYDSNECEHCERLPARAEWFIAFARRRKLSSANLAMASEIRSKLALSTIGESFQKLLMDTIDEIMVTRARKNSTVKQT